MRKFISIFCGLFFLSTALVAQGKLTIDDVKQVYLRNSGVIKEFGEINGYFTFYVSDKIDKHTNEYTVRITDKDLNPIKDIKFTDDKNVQLLESSYNGNSIMFLFYNKEEKTLEYRAYGFDGKQKMSYTKELNKKSKDMLEETYGHTGEDSQNEALFDVGEEGYVTIYPVRDGKYRSYEINFFFTDRKKQWSYEAAEEQEDKYAHAVYLGNTDSLVIFEVIKQKKMMGGNPHSWVLALNHFTGKKAFEMSTESESDFNFYPTNVSTVSGGRNFGLLGTYYKKGDDVVKDKSVGLGLWVMDPSGKLVSKKYNSWKEDFAKYLPVDKKGRVDNIGYVYIHKIIQTDNGKFFAVGEGYSKVVDGMGVAMNVLSRGGGGNSNFKVKISDMALLQFDDKFKVEGVTIYDKYNNSMTLPAGADYMSPHMMATLVKAYGGFDYNYTQADKNHTSFVVGYSDYEKGDSYKGLTFNSISYNNNKITTDKIQLKTKSSNLRVLPAKTGSVVIEEYFKKEKRLEFRMEKLN